MDVLRMIREYDSQVQFHKDLQSFKDSGNELTKMTVLAKTDVWYGDEGTCDVKYCEEHGIPYSHGGTFSGTGCIVGVKGNVIMDVIRRFEGGEALGDKFSKRLCEYFKSRGLESVRCDNNDILIDGYKVASGAEVGLQDGMRYLGFQISIHQDMETIRIVCKKPMLKVPKALSEYGITTEDIVSLCKEYWSVN